MSQTDIPMSSRRGLVGALNEIPDNMCVVTFPNGVRKTIPFLPNQTIRQALAKY